MDAADQLKIAGVWARFWKIGGGFLSQLVIGRSLLGREDDDTQGRIGSLDNRVQFAVDLQESNGGLARGLFFVWRLSYSSLLDYK